MADTKITSLLTPQVTTNPATDVLPIVNIADTLMASSGSTRKITVNQLLGAGGTATLASATITGDLTVDTSTLKVDSANNRVGINIATPMAELHVIGGANFSDGTTTLRAVSSGNVAFLGTTTTDPLVLRVNNIEQYRMGQLGVFSWSDGAGGTRMTLNSTGLGVGVVPTIAKVQTNGAFATTGAVGSISTTPLANALIGDFNTTCRLLATGPNTTTAGVHKFINASSDASVYLESMTLDASGNLLVGTTNATVASAVGSRFIDGGKRLDICRDASTDASIGLDVYSTTAAAYRFYIGLGGTVFATNTTISAISDARLKENVQDLDVGLGAILALKPRKFDWKAGKGKDIKGDRGFIAQEFEQVFPNLVDEWKDPAPEGEAPYKSVRQDLIPVLVKAIQELTARVQTLEAK